MCCDDMACYVYLFVCTESAYLNEVYSSAYLESVTNCSRLIAHAQIYLIKENAR